MTDIYTRRLTPWFLFVQAFSTFTARWKRVLGLGCTITAVTIVTDTLLDSLFHHGSALHGTPPSRARIVPKRRARTAPGKADIGTTKAKVRSEVTSQCYQ